MKRLTILGVVAFIGLIFLPATVIAAGPKDGMDVNVINTPLSVTGEIGATVDGEVEIVNDDSSPVPVKILNGETTTTTIIHQNLYTAGPGGRTIAGPGVHNFNGTFQTKSITIFRVFAGLAVMACYTIQNLGNNSLKVDDGASGGIGPGITETMCRNFIPDQYITVSTYEEGIGKFRWRVDLINNIGDEPVPR